MKKSFINKLIYTSFLFFIFTNIVSAQQASNQSLKEYAKNPYWIKMMDDPKANYFETIKAYNEYWKHHQKPKEEDEIIGGKSQHDAADKHHESWIKKLFAKKEDKDAQEYAFECKKFEHWKIKSEPWVQPDGRILSMDERLEIWKKSKH